MMKQRVYMLGCVVCATACPAIASHLDREAVDAMVRDATEPVAVESGSDEPICIPRDHRWTVSFEPSIWVPALQGEIGVGGSPVFDVDAIDIDENEATPFGRFFIRSGDLSIEFSGFSFNNDQTATASAPVTIGGTGVGAGGAVAYDLTMTSFELTAGYRLWTLPVGKNNPDIEKATDDLEVWIDGYAGVRGFEVDLDFSTPAGVSQGLEDIHAIVGVSLNMDLPNDFGVRFSADGGGGSGGSSFDFTVSFDYEVVEHVTAQIGYRYLRTDLEDNGFTYDVALAGLFASVAIRF